MSSKMASKKPGVKPGDLESAAVCGLLKAFCRANLNNGAELWPYAIKCIKTEIWNSPEYTGGVPRLQSERYWLLRNTQTELILELHHEPTEEEIARRARLPLEQLRDALAAMAYNYPEQPPDEGLDSFPDPHAMNPEEQTIIKQQLKDVERALASGKFTEMEIDVMILLYIKEMKPYKIAELLCLTPNYVNTIHSRVIKKLRNMLTGTGEE